jgi:hypothetical protein
MGEASDALDGNFVSNVEPAFQQHSEKECGK